MGDAQICALFEGWYPRYERCGDGMVGSYHTPVCNCTRVHRTLGRENLTKMGSRYSSQHPAGGEWYSHPIQGRCTGSQRVGDGSGCTWRVVERARSIKATCMYKLTHDQLAAPWLKAF